MVTISTKIGHAKLELIFDRQCHVTKVTMAPPQPPLLTRSTNCSMSLQACMPHYHATSASLASTAPNERFSLMCYLWKAERAKHLRHHCPNTKKICHHPPWRKLYAAQLHADAHANYTLATQLFHTSSAVAHHYTLTLAHSPYLAR